MSLISFELKKALSPLGIEYKEFGDLLLYLMHKSVVCRDDSEIERKFYDQYLMCEILVKDYFEVIGIGVLHNEVFSSVRIFAPDADFPKNNSVSDDKSNKLRMNLSKDEVAALIVCYLLYQQYTDDARLEEFDAVISREEFYAAHATYLSYEPKEQETSRKDVLRKLSKLKIVKFHSDFFENLEHPLVIRPYVMDIILPKTVEQYLDTKENNYED
ncbi:MAG: DUF4194 domain-containing protein [Ignavibacteria bacterium]|nr:DUF4194 domain-containing protein [Ignavibacteria bacterium]